MFILSLFVFMTIEDFSQVDMNACKTMNDIAINRIISCISNSSNSPSSQTHSLIFLTKS